MMDEQSRSVILRCEKISKSFQWVKANQGIDLEVYRGEIHTILGENGAGKSTLMNIIYGIYQPDSGHIIYRGEIADIKCPQDAINLGIGMIHQHFTLVPTLSVLENVILGKTPTHGLFVDYKKAKRIVSELSKSYGLQIDVDSLVGDLPIGIQQKVEILKALYRGADTLIMDEPTAVLTPQETEKLFLSIREMIKLGKTVIFISHKLDEVMEVSDRISILRQGKKFATLSKTKTNKRELARLMVGREVFFQRHQEETETGPVILRVEQISVRDNLGLEKVKGLSLEIYGGEILGIAGISGNGQKELAEAITGLRRTHYGQIYLQKQNITHSSPARIRGLGVAHIPEDRRTQGSILDLNLVDNLIIDRFQRKPFSRFGFLDWKQIHQFARKLLVSYDIKNINEETKADKLSGGNLQRLILARELSSRHQLLVANKPTRGLDVGAIEYVHSQIAAQKKAGVAVLLISEDLNEIFNLCQRIIIMYQGKNMGTVRLEDVSREEIGMMMGGTPLNELKPLLAGKNI